jgi:hypothetical protein
MLLPLVQKTKTKKFYSRVLVVLDAELVSAARRAARFSLVAFVTFRESASLRQ